MQKFNLINLSTELVDAIVNHIDDPRDVLSAALTCKTLYQVTVPYHLEFRHIRCDPRQKDLWDGLCKRPALAAKVRFLEIRWTRQDGPVLSDDILPRSMDSLVPVNGSSSPDKTLDFTSLVKAMEHMDSLVRFSWTGLMPQGIGHLLKATDNLLSPLKEFQISLEMRDFDIGSVDLFSQAFPVEQLPCLRALAITHYCPHGQTHLTNPFYEALATDTGLLLQDLLIDFLPSWNAWYETMKTSFPHFFKTAHLYQLRRFTIHGKVLHSVRQDLVIFLSHHPKLEALWLGSGPPKIKECKIILPNLKALQFHRFPSPLEEVLDRIPEEMYKGLKHLHVPLNDLSILKNTPHLESCYLQRVSNISQLSTKVSLLQRLDFRPILSKNEKEKAKFKIWLKDLSKLTNLTHLSGFFADKQLSILDPDVQKHLQGLANKLRNLKHVEVYYEASAWIIIDRDSNGGYSGFHDAKLPAYKLKEWGTFFYGYH